VQFNNRAILAEATIRPWGSKLIAHPDLGNLLIGAKDHVFTAPWLALAPSLALTGVSLLVHDASRQPPPTPRRRR
jgi:ABC-type dipeptide/oligopeptide/nickel transport system permease subunit